MLNTTSSRKNLAREAEIDDGVCFGGFGLAQISIYFIANGDG